MAFFHPSLPSNVVNCQCFCANMQNNIERGRIGKGFPNECAWECRYQNDLSSQEEASLALKCLNLIIQIFLNTTKTKSEQSSSMLNTVPCDTGNVPMAPRMRFDDGF